MLNKEEKTYEDMQRDAYAEALRRERAGYVMRKLDDRVKAVDAELKRLGASSPAAPASEEQADSAPRETAVESKPRRTAAPRGAKAKD
ncbi:hypothetical protein [Streptomyces sp. NBC_01353]|uniref:hypothetical protein n=1 Tax=Streptomyces sp. NBC_01353 TaxID=2903835 RepID=UPI002E344025|nr:hypothetical protein [Streptomyces sp. NBC_01353]